MNKIEIEQASAASRARILRLLRIHGRLARIDLARLIGLSPATVSSITADLMKDGLVREVPGEEGQAGEGERARGRPKVLIDLVADAACVIAAKISINEIQLALGDFTGAVRAVETMHLGTREIAAEALIERLGEAIADFRARLTRGRGPCLGVGMALQGIVGKSSVLTWSPAFSLRDLPLVDPVAARVGLPVILINDANAIALAIHDRPAYAEIANLGVVMLGAGVGMGLILGGQLYTATSGAAAEFGHTKYHQGGPLCMCGKRGCIESYLADYAIHRDASTLFDLPGGEVQHPSEDQMRSIVARADQGDPRAVELYSQIGRVLGFGLGNLIALVSPDLVIVTGPGVRAWRHIESRMRRGLSDAVIGTLLANTRIEPMSWDEDLVFRGAFGQVLDRQPG